MIINLVSEYIPETIVPNEYFKVNFGIYSEDIISKSGIRERRICGPGENTNTMAIQAVRNALPDMTFPITDIDLIIGGGYTPYDTVGTLAHAVQKEFNINNARCFSIDSACSSFINAIEICEGYFAINKAQKALIVISENNSAYNDVADKRSGFLWGDGAAAIIITKERHTSEDFEVLDVNTTGLGNIGKSIDAVYARPMDGGLRMPQGRDVFQYACKYMLQETEQILQRNLLEINQLSYLIPHQANARITDFVVGKLNLNPSQVLTNIEQLGNTGSASTPIILSQNRGKFKKGELIIISVFGGGYSSGAVLLKKL